MKPHSARLLLLDFARETELGVFHCSEWGQSIEGDVVDALQVLAISEGKARLCMHPSVSDAEHQMLVAIAGSTKDAIHLHPDKRETAIVVRGEALHRTYNHLGSMVREVNLSPLQSTYVNTDAGVPHHVVITSDVLIFWEIAQGPFRAGSTVPFTPTTR